MNLFLTTKRYFDIQSLIFIHRYDNRLNRIVPRLKLKKKYRDVIRYGTFNDTIVRSGIQELIDTLELDIEILESASKYNNLILVKKCLQKKFRYNSYQFIIAACASKNIRFTKYIHEKYNQRCSYGEIFVLGNIIVIKYAIKIYQNLEKHYIRFLVYQNIAIKDIDYRQLKSAKNFDEFNTSVKMTQYKHWTYYRRGPEPRFEEIVAK